MMQVNKKIILGVIVLAAFVSALVSVGLRNDSTPLGGAAPTVPTAGVTNANPRIAQTNVTFSANSTFDTGSFSTNAPYQVASIANTDSNDRIVTGFDFTFTNLSQVSTSTTGGLIYIIAATSTTATTSGNTNFMLQNGFATTTPILYVGSTTPGSTGTSINRIWPAGTNLVFMANATSASPLILRVNYIPE